MINKKTLLSTTVLFGTIFLGACIGPEEEPMIQSETTVVELESEESSESRMPALPTAMELAEVMKTYESHEEYKGKLAEVGLLNPEYILNDQALAGDGVNEFKANIHFYKASDGYFALYEKEDEILKDLPESIAMNVWTIEETEAFVADKTESE